MRKSGSDISRRSFVGGAAALAAGGLPSQIARAQSEAPAPKRGGILKISAYLNPTKLDPITGEPKGTKSPNSFISDAGSVYATALDLSGIPKANQKGRNKGTPLAFVSVRPTITPKLRLVYRMIESGETLTAPSFICSIMSR